MAVSRYETSHCLRIVVIVLMFMALIGCSASSSSDPLILEDSKSGGVNVDILSGRRSSSTSTYTLRFSDIDFEYDADGIPDLSVDLLALNGMEVTIQGYMAPPLQVENHFFVLTRYPVFACPFCTAAEDWVGDFIVVYAEDWLYEHKQAIEVTGILDLGAYVDEETGLVSFVRIQTPSVTRLN